MEKVEEIHTYGHTFLIGKYRCIKSAFKLAMNFVYEERRKEWKKQEWEWRAKEQEKTRATAVTTTTATKLF